MAPTLAGVDEPGAAVHGFLAELRAIDVDFQLSRFPRRKAIEHAGN